jgi:hypothetical protein
MHRYKSSTVMLKDGDSQHFGIPLLLWSRYSAFGLLYLDMVLWGSINFRDYDIIYNLDYNVKFQLIYKSFVSFIILFFETVDWKVKSEIVCISISRNCTTKRTYWAMKI